MCTLAELSEEMHRLLTTTANQVACETGFVQRASKLTGAHFAQALVLGWLNNPAATLQQLAQMAGTVGVAISPQGIDQRFSATAATFLQRLVEAAVTTVISGESTPIPLLQRFQGVYVLDSSTIVLPDELADVWRGSGGGNGQHTRAAVRLQVQFDLATGALIGPVLQDGRAHDRSAPRQTQFPAQALRVADLGYFSTQTFAELDGKGIYWLSRLHMLAQLFDAQRTPLPLSALPAWLRQRASTDLDTPLFLGSPQGIPIRLLALRVPDAVAADRRRRLREEAKRKGQHVSAHRLALAEWTLLVTNAPKEVLAFDEALVIARARWQIELLFKLWKQHGLLDESRSLKPWRQLCELYAKMLGLLIQHWLLVVNCWRYPNRSLTQAAQTIRRYATALALVLSRPDHLTTLLMRLYQCLSVGCRISTRKTVPATFQRLLLPTLKT
jgi:DDE family transposase